MCQKNRFQDVLHNSGNKREINLTPFSNVRGALNSLKLFNSNIK